MPSDYALALALLAAAWLLGALARGAVRRALTNGLRCLARYPTMWRIPALFGLGYAGFQLAATALLHLRLEETFPVFAWDPPPAAAALAALGWLPAAERTAAVFTVFTATFPLSALCALLFLGNAGGLLGELARALRKRFGRGRGGGVLFLLVVAALAAVAKPAAYLLLPEISERVPFLAVMAVGALSGAFELLLGIFFLTYLMLTTHAWLRGIRFERQKLRRLAMRRTGYVLKWSLVVLALAGAFIFLPVLLALLFEPMAEGMLWFSNVIGRPVTTAVALIYCPVQAILVFHNESLRDALREGRRLLARHWPDILPFFLVASASFFALETATGYATARLGGETLAALACRVAGAGIEAFFAGWLIASWVCLYKGFSAGRKEVLF